MAKDIKNPKPGKSNRSGRKASSNNQLQLIHVKDPKPNDKSIKAKFMESGGAEVSEQIHGW
jgi:hypothetical protein